MPLVRRVEKLLGRNLTFFISQTLFWIKKYGDGSKLLIELFHAKRAEVLNMALCFYVLFTRCVRSSTDLTHYQKMRLLYVILYEIT